MEQKRRCSTAAPSFAWTSRKCTVLDSVALNTFTGTLTSPKAIVPFQIERAMAGVYPHGRGTHLPRPPSRVRRA